MERPFTVRTLAEHWDCSEPHIRNMIARGELRAWRAGGKLLRIGVSEVERYESEACQQSTDLPQSKADISSSGTMRTDEENAIRWVRMTRPSLKQALQNSNERGS